MRTVTGVAVLALLASAGCAGCGKAPDERVVVYCAQDEEFAVGVFADFEKAAKLTVAPKFDTEANKSVSLATELEAEAGRPRCDLHWNNEILGTIRLARKGVYEAYSSPAAAPYPPWSKARDGTWQAFASRARALIVNTNLVPDADRPKSLLDLTVPGSCTVNCNNNWGIYAFHAGGANALFADGSVHFLRVGLDRDVFAGLVTRAGGEVLDGSAY